MRRIGRNRASFDGAVRTGDDGRLLCPNCDGEYLHHDAITAFERREDADITRVTTITADEVTTEASPSLSVDNPSSRRHGLAIAFWCELCDVRSELTIAQHKGTTFVEWRESLTPPACAST